MYYTDKKYFFLHYSESDETYDEAVAVCENVGNVDEGKK